MSDSPGAPEQPLDQPTPLRRPWQRDWRATFRNSRAAVIAVVAGAVLAVGLGGFAVGHATADGSDRSGHHDGHSGRGHR
jgi:hypothetical protein